MLPAVIRLNGQRHADWYAELMREVDPSVREAEAPERLANLVTRWLEESGLATSLNALEIPASGIESFVEEALQQWTGTFNPVPLDKTNAEMLYRSVA
jgi:alcohol dehydrogenase